MEEVGEEGGWREGCGWVCGCVEVFGWVVEGGCGGGRWEGWWVGGWVGGRKSYLGSYALVILYFIQMRSDAYYIHILLIFYGAIIRQILHEYRIHGIYPW